MELVVAAIDRIADILSAPWSIRDWIVLFIPLLISIISTLIAIYVPYRIMNKQNKIALFEKRFIIYQLVLEIIDYSNNVKKFRGLPNNPNPTDLELAHALYSIWCNNNEKTSIAFDAYYKEPQNVSKRIQLISITNDILNSKLILLKSTEFLFNKKISTFALNMHDRYKKYIELISFTLLESNIKDYRSIAEELYTFAEKSELIVKEFVRSLSVS